MLPIRPFPLFRFNHRHKRGVPATNGGLRQPGARPLFGPMGFRGFSLVEIVIVVAILAIVVSLALPSYISHVRKARRADATSTLLNSAQQLERCFTRFNAYNDAACSSPVGASADGFYAITAVIDASTYTLTATPLGAQGSDPCGIFTLDHLGNKTPVPGVNRCWGS